MFKDDYVGTASGIKCPITGSDLIYDGYEYDTMDGNSYYHSEADISLRWEKNARSFYYELKHPDEISMRMRDIIESRRYFKIEDNGKWQEYFAKISTPTIQFFPVGTSMIEVDRILQLDIEIKKQREDVYKSKVKSKEIDLLPFPLTKIKHLTIASDLISVKPISKPQGDIFYLDYNTKETDFDYLSEKNKI